MNLHQRSRLLRRRAGSQQRLPRPRVVSASSSSSSASGVILVLQSSNGRVPEWKPTVVVVAGNNNNNNDDGDSADSEQTSEPTFLALSRAYRSMPDLTTAGANCTRQSESPDQVCNSAERRGRKMSSKETVSGCGAGVGDGHRRTGRAVHHMLSEKRNVAQHRKVRRLFRVDSDGSPSGGEDASTPPSGDQSIGDRVRRFFDRRTDYVYDRSMLENRPRSELPGGVYCPTDDDDDSPRSPFLNSCSSAPKLSLDNNNYCPLNGANDEYADFVGRRSDDNLKLPILLMSKRQSIL